ncbi:hypothetical protein [Rhizobium sp. SL86]|uniref:hypothetical protein n=1 Tax=Rhizobium sp. SL86 TaxID=2995148 RepID=UPI002273CD7E|nr:hypothetical protein [Rhizobium sp. SL86]MCY1669141.1 hypothetical protein [Rhizobium sp. SL86]
MKRVAALALVALLGAGTIAFATELSHASEGRLSIHSVGDTVSQVDVVHGERVAETYRVKPDHTLTLVARTPIDG